jgi:hypothetical protein
VLYKVRFDSIDFHGKKPFAVITDPVEASIILNDVGLLAGHSVYPKRVKQLMVVHDKRLTSKL